MRLYGHHPRRLWTLSAHSLPTYFVSASCPTRLLARRKTWVYTRMIWIKTILLLGKFLPFVVSDNHHNPRHPPTITFPHRLQKHSSDINHHWKKAMHYRHLTMPDLHLCLGFPVPIFPGHVFEYGTGPVPLQLAHLLLGHHCALLQST